MLRIFRNFRDMNFEKLMAVYQESNLENAQAFFPDDSSAEQQRKTYDAFAEYLRQDFFRVKGAFYAVWEAENCYISALRMEPFEDGLLRICGKADLRCAGSASVWERGICPCA